MKALEDTRDTAAGTPSLGNVNPYRSVSSQFTCVPYQVRLDISYPAEYPLRRDSPSRVPNRSFAATVGQVILMPRFDFTCLSSQDFEDLVRDLLQAEWNVALEGFKSGRDAGIDFRYSPTDGGKTIIQCKHYVGSGFNKLLRHLSSTERQKIERVRPARYVVVTSVALTPGNKDKIARALHPYVVNVADVIGAGDLEGLLSKHPAIERANFKLWLTSVSVIERVLHNAEVCQTEFEIARIRRKLPLFVQGEAFPLRCSCSISHA